LSASGQPAQLRCTPQHPFRANEIQFAIRTQLEPLSLVKPVQELVRGMNPEVAMKFTTMQSMAHESVAAPRFRTTLALTFAALAMLLAAMGVYAVMSYVTVQRTAIRHLETGTRRRGTLGADRRGCRVRVDLGLEPRA
jgi:hypothetical protein